MRKMEQDAKKWKWIVDKLGIQRKYIAEQTGLKETEISAFWEIAEDMAMADGFDYNRIYDAMKQFMDSELVVGNFQYIDDMEFSDILSKLREEFELSSNELEKRIRKRIEANYSEQEREKDAEVMAGFWDYQIRKHGIDILMDTTEILEARRKKLKELRADCERIDDLLTYGISVAVDIDPETGEYIEEEYTFSAEERACMIKQRSEQRTKIQQLEAEISQLLHQDEQDWEEYSALLRENTSSDHATFRESRRIDRSIKRTERHKIVKDDYAYNAVQQKAILELFFDLCTDQDGYVLPDHFGSGINLACKIEEKTVWTGGWKNLRGIQKVTYWTTEDIISGYAYNEPINIIESSDSVYRLIQEHPQVFFHDPCIRKVESFMKMLRDVPQDVRKKLFHKLADASAAIMPRTAKTREYYGILSEYYDILSLPIPVANFKFYGKEEIYRIVYEIAAASDGSIRFSNELVHSVFLRIRFKAKHWLWQMYLSQYYFHHKEFESLTAYIEKETNEPEV